jgi:hypothetical protein
LFFHPEDTVVPPKRPSTYTRLCGENYLASRLSRNIYRGDATTGDLQSVKCKPSYAEERGTPNKIDWGNASSWLQYDWHWKGNNLK